MMQANWNSFFLYLKLECKKYRTALPRILSGMLLILILLTGILTVCQLNAAENDKKNLIKIGIVAQKDEPYLDWIITTVQNMKSTKFTCQFVSLEEEDANKKLHSGELTAIFVIPKDYIRSLIRGDKAPMIVRLGKEQTTIASFLVKQLGDAASRVMIDTQAGIYALKNYYKNHQLPNRSKAETALNIEYLQKALTREQMFQLEEIETGNYAVNGAYYFSSVMPLLLLLLGLTCPGILRPEPSSLHEKLCVRGLNIWQNALARYLAFISVFLILYAGMALLFTVIFPMTGKHITGAAPNGRLDWLATFLLLLPSLFLICAFLQFIYQIVHDELGSVLFLFLLIAVLGYLSGYFYPLSYLPATIRRLAPFLPTGVLFRYVHQCIIGSWSLTSCLSLLLYSAILSRQGLTKS